MCSFGRRRQAPNCALPAERISFTALPNLRDYLTASRFNQRRKQWWNRLVGSYTTFAVGSKGGRDLMLAQVEGASGMRAELTKPRLRLLNWDVYFRSETPCLLIALVMLSLVSTHSISLSDSFYLGRFGFAKLCWVYKVWLSSTHLARLSKLTDIILTLTELPTRVWTWAITTFRYQFFRQD